MVGRCHRAAVAGFVALMLGGCATGYVPTRTDSSAAPVVEGRSAARPPESASRAGGATPAAAADSPASTGTAPVAPAEPAAGVGAPSSSGEVVAGDGTRPLPAPGPESESRPSISTAIVGDEPWLTRRKPGNLWDRVRRGFALPELPTTLVEAKERFYLERPDYLDRMMERAGRYLYHIVEEVERRGLPTELALLPFVESAMNPTAVSSAKAAGLWQFIPSTGRAYDLKQNWWVDNRRDVVQSTRAALDYLEKLYALHGNDWFLALASYNWGEAAVARAVRRNAARGRSTDYLSLDMPRETRHYIPKLIAIKHIVARAEELGITLPALPDSPYFITIEEIRPIDLKLAARFAGMSVTDFVALNPAHNRPVISAPRGHGIKLPADRVENFLQAIEAHERADRVFASWQPYTLKSGDTIERIAHKSGVGGREILQANGLRPNQRLLPGSQLLVPHRQVADESRVADFVAPRIIEVVDHPPMYHRVGRGDSLARIARRYGMTEHALREMNGLRRGEPRRGARLLVRRASTNTVLTDEKGTRRVLSTLAPAKSGAKAASRPGVPPASKRKTRSGKPSTTRR